MRFQVPQFIEREPKVVGPLTLRQFIYLGIAGVIMFFVYFIYPFPVFVGSAIIFGGIGLALAFLKIGGRSLPQILWSFFRFEISSKTYLWKRKGMFTDKFKEIEYVSAQKNQTDSKKIALAQGGKIKNLAVQVETKK